MIEPILEDTSEGSLSLDHTSDIMQDIPEQIPISLAHDHFIV